MDSVVGLRACWRREEFIIVGDVSNWSNGIWASAKPLPNGHPDSVDIKARHGERKEAGGTKSGKVEGGAHPLNAEPRTFGPHV
jgi:hypothetical protein